MQFHEACLPNGLQVIAEINSSVYSVGVAFVVRTGARDETLDVSGVSHFLEHMAFKGNEKFSADDVNRIFDEVGAKYNAATAEDITVYYAVMLPEYLEPTFELLAALIQPSLRVDDFEMEKKVIIEEIGMYDDQPTFVAYEKAMQLHYARHPLGQSILGTKESITALTAEQMKTYHSARYGAGNVLLVATGNAPWDQIQSLAEKYCAHWAPGMPGRQVHEHISRGGVEQIVRESSQQQHLMQMTMAPAARHPLRNAAELLSVIVGDDSGSRLFWELVDPGHVETAELAYQEFDGSGVFRLFFNGTPETTEENLARVQRVFDDINTNGVTSEELHIAKSKLLSRIVLSGERPMGRLDSLGTHWLYRGAYHSLKQDLDLIRSVTVEQIRDLLTEFPLRQLSTVSVGPRGDLDLG